MRSETANKLDCFIGEQTVISLTYGEPQEILPGVLVTVINEKCDVLVEILDGKRQVRVGERSAIDVAQIKSGQPFFVDGLECFVLRPYQVYVSQTCKQKDVTMPPPPEKKRGAATYPNKRILPAVSCFFLLVGVCWLFGGESQSQPGEHDWPEFPSYQSESNKGQTAQPFLDVSSPLSRKEVHKETGSNHQSPELTQPFRQQKNTKAKHARHMPRAAAALWREYQECMLEAKFDPHSARQKLWTLRPKVPVGSKLRGLIDAEIGRL